MTGNGEKQVNGLALVLPFILLAFAVSPAFAAGGEDPDWPCIQRLVPEISAGMVWAGPPLDEAPDWQADGEVADLAPRLAKRAIPLAEAERAVEDFAGKQGAAKDRKLTMLFAGVFTQINAERNTVIAGIKRFAGRQKQLAARIEGQLAELGFLPADQDARRTELIEQNRWDSRIYDRREASLVYLCETPVLLEQRLFALGRAVQYHLD